MIKDTVPAKGEEVYLRSTANLSTGGTAIDVTDTIHPDNREMAIRSIRAIDLDIGGVDFLTKDISESYRDAVVASARSMRVPDSVCTSRRAKERHVTSRAR